MTNREKRFFMMAREVSFLSDFKTARLGAVVVDGNRVLSSGYNSYKTRPLQHKYNIYRHFDNYELSIPRQHAEVDALSPLIGKEIDWSRIAIFVYRELRNGERGCSRPCAACSQLIHDLGIKTIYYINENGVYVKEKVIQ